MKWALSNVTVHKNVFDSLQVPDLVASKNENFENQVPHPQLQLLVRETRRNDLERPFPLNN